MPSFRALSRAELSELSALQLAYIGDSVYDLLVKSKLLENRAKLRAMHLAAVGRVRASAQAESLMAILPHLSAEESDYVRMGRNAHSHHQPPRSASAADYAMATALECLFGYLYVTSQEERMQELFLLSLGPAGQRDETSESRLSKG